MADKITDLENIPDLEKVVGHVFGDSVEKFLERNDWIQFHGLFFIFVFIYFCFFSKGKKCKKLK